MCIKWELLEKITFAFLEADVAATLVVVTVDSESFLSSESILSL